MVPIVFVWLGIAYAAGAARETVPLFDDTVRIPRSQWRAFNFSLHQRPAALRVRYRAVSGEPRLRVLLMNQEEAENFRAGRRHRALTESEMDSAVELTYPIAAPGDYQLLLDNRVQGAAPAEVHLTITLVFDQSQSFTPPVLPVETRRRVVVLSLLAFACVGGWSGWKVLSAFRRRDRAERWF